MSHRFKEEQPILKEKSLPDEQLIAKNYYEIAKRYNITDRRRLEMLFSSSDPDLVIEKDVEIIRNGMVEKEHIQIRSYNLAIMHDRPCGICIAERDSGKSVLTYQILATKSFIPCCFVTSTTDGISGFYQTVVPDNHVFCRYSPQKQRQLVDAQEMVCEIAKEKWEQDHEYVDCRCALIEDDVAHDRRLHEDAAMDQVGTSGRHIEFFGWCNVQKLQRVSPTFRQNSDVIVIFACDNQDVRKEIWKHYCGYMSYKSFCEILTDITREPFHCMVIANRGRDKFKPIDQRIYHFRAFKEECVDALLGDGEVSRTGELLKPCSPHRYWQFGDKIYKEPRIEQTIQGDDIEVFRSDLNREEDEVDDQEGFDPFPWSLSQRYINKERQKKQKRYLAGLKTVVRNSGG